MGNLIAVVASMDREVSAALLQMRGASIVRSSDVGQRDSVIVMITGVGKEKTLAAMSALMGQPTRPSVILSTGFAGGLVEGLHTGDLVLAPRMHSTQDDAVLVCDDHLMALAREMLTEAGSPRHVVADSATAPGMVLTAQEKQRLADCTGAWAVNMEDYWIGKVADEWHVPFLSVRAVLDTFDQQIPGFVAGLGDMTLPGQLLRVIPNLATSPGIISHLIRLSKQAKVAQESLAAAILPLVNRITLVGTCTV